MNPDRCKYPSLYSDIEISTEIDTAEKMLVFVNSKFKFSSEKFDLAKIESHDVSWASEKNNKGEIVDKIELLRKLKISRWYGPYKKKEVEHYQFYYFDGADKFSYLARIYLKASTGKLYYGFSKNSSWCGFKGFSNKSA